MPPQPEPIQPDPDLSAADPAVGSSLNAAVTALDAHAAQVRSDMSRLDEAAGGTTVHAEEDSLREEGARLAVEVSNLHQALTLHNAATAAAAAYRGNTVSVAAIEVADAQVAEAWRVLMAAAEGPGWPQARASRIAAEKHAAELRERRNAAIAAYREWEAAAAAELRAKRKVGLPRPTDRHTPAPDAPRTTAPTAPVPAAAAAAASGAPAPVAPTELPSGTTPPAQASDTSLAAVTGTSSSGLTPAQAAVLGAALAQQQQGQQQQPVQIPAPMAGPAPPLSPQQPQRRAEDPLADYDPNAVLAGLARGDYRVPAATVAAPAITPAAAPEPTFTPLGLTGAAAVNPVVAQPITTGTSLTGLETTSNVSGRPDGATARTATSPGPATNLSGASADQSTARPAAAGAGTGMGGAQPMMGPMMSGMGGAGGGKDRATVTATMTPEQARLLGLEAIGEAVPGGTIARKDDAA